MIRFFRDLFRIIPGVLAALFIGITITLFVVFPRVVNELASLTGNMGDPLELGPAIVHGLIALLIDVVIVYFFMLLPLRRFRRERAGEGLMVQKGQGVAYIDTESVRQQIFAAVSKIPDVDRVRVSVENHLGRANVQLNLLTDNTINGSKKKAEVLREVKKVVEDQLGVLLAGDPVINLSLEPVTTTDIPQAVIPQAMTPAPVAPPPTPARTPAPEAVKPAPEPVRTAPIPEPPKLEPIQEPTALENPAATNDAPVFTRRAFTPMPLPRPELARPESATPTDPPAVTDKPEGR